jgi:hypothetical protein
MVGIALPFYATFIRIDRETGLETNRFPNGSGGFATLATVRRASPHALAAADGDSVAPSAQRSIWPSHWALGECLPVGVADAVLQSSKMGLGLHARAGYPVSSVFSMQQMPASSQTSC